MVSMSSPPGSFRLSRRGLPLKIISYQNSPRCWIGTDLSYMVSNPPDRYVRDSDFASASHGRTSIFNFGEKVNTKFRFFFSALEILSV